MKTTSSNKFASLLLAVGCSLGLGCQPASATEPPASEFKWVETEKLVAALPSRNTPFLISPDQLRVAFRVDDGERTYAELEGKRYPWVEFSNFQFSPDSRRVAYVVQDARGTCAVVDGTEEPRYKTLRAFTFSPDGKSWAYVGGSMDPAKTYGSSSEPNPFTIGECRSGIDPAGVPSLTPCATKGADKAKEPNFWSCLVVNGKEGPRYSNLKWFAFSPDWTHRACVVAWAKGDTLLVDDREIGTYRTLDAKSIVFSQDGKHFACVAGDADQAKFVVVDGKEGQHHRSQPSVPELSPDGQRFAYWVKEGDFISVFVDGTLAYKGAGWEVLGSVLFSPDSRHWAVEIGGGGSTRVVLDGTEQKGYFKTWRSALVDGARSDAAGRSLKPNSIRFTRDGHLSYLATDGRAWFDCLDGEERNCGNSISEVVRSQALDRQAFFRGAGKSRTLVLDGVEVPLRSAPKPGTFAFSPEGKHYAFASERSDGQCMTVDGVDGSTHWAVYPKSVAFSPAGGDAAYFVKDQDRLGLVWKGRCWPVKEGAGGASHRSISISPDGKHLAYRPAVSCVVVDNQRGKEYDEVFQNDDRTVFDASDCFHYLARRLNNFYLVEARLVPAKALPN